MTQWGIDLGGTKIEIVVLQNGQSIFRHRIETEAAKGYTHIVGRILELLMIAKQSVQLQPSALGIGIPGTIGSDGLVMNANTVCLNGQPLLADLQAEFGFPVAIANDANCFALAEATLGAAQGLDIVFATITGTGVGGGLVIGGRAIQGHSGIAGEWGHNVLEPEGEQCYCGKRGCNETVFSGPALERFYERESGEKLSLRQISAGAEQGNSPAQATLRRLFESYGKAIATVVNIVDPDAVVLGGGVSNVPGFASAAAEEAKKWIFHPRPNITLLPAQLGDSAGVFGAAMLCKQLG